MDTIIGTITEDQKKIFNTVMKAVTDNRSCQIFKGVSSRFGKTYVLNAILDAVRSSNLDGCIVLAMSTTGKVAQLLNMGRIFYSRLKVPLHPDETSIMNITKMSQISHLVKAKLLLIHDVAMLHKFKLRAL